MSSSHWDASGFRHPFLDVIRFAAAIDNTLLRLACEDPEVPGRILQDVRVVGRKAGVNVFQPADSPGFDSPFLDSTFVSVLVSSRGVFGIRGVCVIATQWIESVADVDGVAYLEHIETARAVRRLVHWLLSALPSRSRIVGSLIPEVFAVAVKDKPNSFVVEGLVLKLTSCAVIVVNCGFNFADNHFRCGHGFLLCKCELIQ